MNNSDNIIYMRICYPDTHTPKQTFYVVLIYLDQANWWWYEGKRMHLIRLYPPISKMYNEFQLYYGYYPTLFSIFH